MALTLDHVAVSGNSTVGDYAYGGGIYGDAVALTNSTVSGNSTTGELGKAAGSLTLQTL